MAKRRTDGGTGGKRKYCEPEKWSSRGITARCAHTHTPCPHFNSLVKTVYKNVINLKYMCVCVPERQTAVRQQIWAESLFFPSSSSPPSSFLHSILLSKYWVNTEFGVGLQKFITSLITLSGFLSGSAAQTHTCVCSVFISVRLHLLPRYASFWGVFSQHTCGKAHAEICCSLNLRPCRRLWGNLHPDINKSL